MFTSIFENSLEMPFLRNSQQVYFKHDNQIEIVSEAAST